MTQADMVLLHMQECGGISPREALELYGCMRLASRISDLKRRGVAISKVMECGTNRFGETVRYARYTLVKEEEE